MNLKIRMVRLRTMEITLNLMNSSMGMKKLEISDILIAASWILAILDMEMEFSWRN
jgi:hypothetical protein